MQAGGKAPPSEFLQLVINAADQPHIAVNGADGRIAIGQEVHARGEEERVPGIFIRHGERVHDVGLAAEAALTARGERRPNGRGGLRQRDEVSGRGGGAHEFFKLRQVRAGHTGDENFHAPRRRVGGPDKLQRGIGEHELRARVTGYGHGQGVGGSDKGGDGKARLGHHFKGATCTGEQSLSGESTTAGDFQSPCKSPPTPGAFPPRRFQDARARDLVIQHHAFAARVQPVPLHRRRTPGQRRSGEKNFPAGMRRADQSVATRFKLQKAARPARSAARLREVIGHGGRAVRAEAHRAALGDLHVRPSQHRAVKSSEVGAVPARIHPVALLLFLRFVLRLGRGQKNSEEKREQKDQWAVNDHERAMRSEAIHK